METYNKKHWNKDNLESKYLKKYTCGWCGYKFKQYVGKYYNPEKTNKKERGVSSQVKCKSCKNFIPTWEE